MTTAPAATSAREGSALPAAVIAALIIGGLYLGREIFVPIALAILLSFVLAPPSIFWSAGVCRARLPFLWWWFWHSWCCSVSAA
jgi:predicted PurR-regulated permease PerM